MKGETGSESGPSRGAALFDWILVVGVLVAVKQSLLPYTMLYAGPASTLSAMIVATLLLRLRGMTWGELGFRWPERLPVALLQVVVVIGFMLAAMAGAGYLADQFFESVGDSGRFSHVEGNLLAYLIMMGLIWTHAAFFEELLFRAFLISRGSAIFGGRLRGDLLGVLIAALFFGYRHYYYQGMNGAITIAAVGFALGLLYLWFGRKSLFPLIVAHGLIDTLGMTFRYLGVEE